MKIQDFLKLNSDQQLAWIDQNIEEYEVLLYNDGYLGCSYPTEQIDLEEYENYPMDSQILYSNLYYKRQKRYGD